MEHAVCGSDTSKRCCEPSEVVGSHRVPVRSSPVFKTRARISTGSGFESLTAHQTPEIPGLSHLFDPASGPRNHSTTNPGNGIRIDEGIPSSSWPSQQVDHVVVRAGGRILGPDGKPIVAANGGDGPPMRSYDFDVGFTLPQGPIWR